VPSPLWRTHGDGHELLLAFIERQDNGEPGAVTCLEEHVVEPVGGLGFYPLPLTTRFE
jgi:hypothetical protein